MKVIKIAFAFVFLCGFGNALPDVGYCSFMKYFCKARRCTTVFYKDLQKDPSAKCSVKYRTMVDCVRKVVNDCVRGLVSQSQVDAILAKNFKESNYCLKGSFSVPENSPSVSLPCTSTYLQKAPLCGKTFHEKFVANRSDPSLCSEQSKAKKCVRDLLASECTFNSQTRQLLDLALGDYNPFCANNRDPGATGRDQCFGYLPGPTQSPTRPPTTLFFYGQSTLPHDIVDSRTQDLFYYGQSTLPSGISAAKKRRNNSDVISVKQYIVLFLLGLYFALV